ncbi:hypothetical protein MBLNU459_g3769t1 [Dothideomycetes sp. NU459]
MSKARTSLSLQPGQRASIHRASMTASFDKPRRPNTPNNMLASLRATQIVALKPVLPAELLAAILDYLPVADLLQCARASRRLQEMVYDDTRWIQKLKAMGVWNDAEARQRYEESLQKKMAQQKPKDPDGIGVGATAVRPRPQSRSITIFDVQAEEAKQRTPLDQPLSPSRPRHKTVADGFDDLTISPEKRAHLDPNMALDVLRRVRSIRGQARQEYGKIYGALAPFYFDITQSQDSAESLLFRTCTDPEKQARILANLRIFARSDGAQKWRNREEKLESAIATFENAAVREFEQAYHVQDTEHMREYAYVLVALNGGAAGIDIFISNHPYMVRKEQVGNPLDCVEGVAYGHADLNPSQKFFEKLAIMLTEQASIIDQTFPASVDVLLPFVTRICEDVVSEYINTLFDEARAKNAETYLKAVSGVFAQALRFGVSLKPSKASTPEFQAEVQQIVKRCFEPHVDLYLTEELEFFRKRSEQEVTAWDKDLSDQEARTESFFMSNISRQAAKRDFLSSFKKVVMMPVNALPAFPSASKASPAPQMTPAAVAEQSSRPSTPRIGSGLPLDRPSTPQAVAPTTELAAKTAIMNSRLEGIKSLFSIEVALNLVHYAKASIERAAAFARMGDEFGDKAKEQCQTIFINLLAILGRQHVQTGFDKAVGHLSSYNPREVKELRGKIGNSSQQNSSSGAGVEPLVTFLELVNVGDLIQQMVDVFYAQELVATNLSDSSDFLNPAVKEKKRFEQMLDERVAAGMGKGIDVLMDEVEYQCATLQQATDFNPGGVDKNEKSGGLIDIGPTATSTRVVETISSHTSMLVGSTDKHMLDVFNQEVGLRLFGVLCKHIKRQRISVDGAIKLISLKFPSNSDINAYSTFVATLRQKSLLPYYSALRELSQIYLIDCTTSSSATQRTAQAKELATIIADTDRYRGIFGAEEVYEFAERRADWYSVRRDVERAMYGIGCAVM